ncbi:hypothetical protein ASG36_19760 [Geodermatophilus sp. Leaf369]|uniref:hypothetical protein n=1 Tax=Geodermatophilus sp. Leaf369 TaxID=1736354 RepID=UPI0006FD19C4|nr:hypothetical protein [Geodermatophilus sp. Leaf369]KQS54697.1 hypothetical protein ASG36_19760 [Geodermatophilus sp. Leaf369]
MLTTLSGGDHPGQGRRSRDPGSTWDGSLRTPRAPRRLPVLVVLEDGGVTVARADAVTRPQVVVRF